MSDIFSILNIVCAVVGGLIFVFSTLQVNKILKLFPSSRMTKDWKIIRILIVFFLVGYILNIIAVLQDLQSVLLVMQALVYLFGALFVLMVIRLSLKTYKVILKTAGEDQDVE